MNKSYKSVWNESTGAWVAVSELATGRSKSKRAKTALSKAILTQIAVGGMSLAGAGAAMADDANVQDKSATVAVADGVPSSADSDASANVVSTPSLPHLLGAQLLGATDPVVPVVTGSAYLAQGKITNVGADNSAVVSGADSLAVGAYASANDSSVAIGTRSLAGAGPTAAFATAIGYQASATASQSVALGVGASSSGYNSVALGQGSLADVSNTISVGKAGNERKIVNVAAGSLDASSTDVVNGSQLSSTNQSVTNLQTVVNTITTEGVANPYLAQGKITAAGADNTAKATGSDSLGVGAYASASDSSVAIGTRSVAGSPTTAFATAIGYQASATGSQSVALGVGASSSAFNSVALGQGSVADVSNTVSVGKVGGERKITNVAAGAAATDAVNVGQLTAAGLNIGTSGAVTNPLVTYDTTAKDSITLAGSNGAQIHKVIAGTADTDATNVAQLKAMGATIGTSGVVTNAFVAYTDTTKTAVSLGNGTVGAKITNLQNGAISASSREAVNGSQLAAVASSAASALGGGSTMGADGKISAPTYTVNSKAYTTLDSALNAAAGSGGGTDPLAVHYTDATLTSVALGTAAAPVKLTGVAAGTANTDAVNVAQMNAATNGLSGVVDKLRYINFGPSTAAQSQATGTDSMAIGGNSFATANQSLAFGLNARASAINSVAIGVNSSTNQANTVSIGGVGKERRLINVADGTGDTDAVTLGQVTQMFEDASTKNVQQVVQSTPKQMVSATRQTGLLGASLLGVGAASPAFTLNDVIAIGPTGQLASIEAIGTDSIAMGLNVHATGDSSVAIGSNVNSTNVESVSVGYMTIANGNAAASFGTRAQAVSDGGLAMGNNAMVDGDSPDGIAIGSGSLSANDRSLAIGKTSLSAGKQSIVLGNQSSVFADGSVVIGNNNLIKTATATGSFVLGSGNTVTGANSYVIGSNNTKVSGSNSIVLGNGSDGTQSNVVSVGGVGTERKVVNVAAGTTNTDAVNLGQMTTAIKAATSSSSPSPETVLYDSTAHDKVTFGKAGVSTTLSNVSAGVAATDAVNVGQLTAMGAKVDTNGVATNAFVAYDSTLKNSVTLGNGTIGAQIHQVVAGSTATDAVNVGQLTAMGAKVDTNGVATNAFVAYDTTAKDSVTMAGANGAQIHKVIAGSTATDAVNVGQLTAAGLIVNTSGVVTNAFVAYDTTAKDSVTLAGANGAQIHKVIAGSTATDAVNVGQLTAAGLIVNTSGVVTNAFVAYDTTAKDSVTLAGANGAQIHKVIAGSTATDAVNVGQLTAMGATIGTSGVMTNAFVAYTDTTKTAVSLGNGTVGAKITNLQNGAVTAASRDAINGSQLYGASAATAAAIGGGSTVDANGAVTKPKVTVAGTDYDNLSGAITATAALAQTGSVDGVKYDTSAHDKVTFNKGSVSTTLSNVAAGVTTTDAVNVGQLAALGATVGTSGVITNAFVAYDTTAKDSVTLAGSNGAQIHKVIAGSTATDAVNVGQLTAMGATIGTSGAMTNAFVAYTDTTKTAVSLGNGTVGAKITNLQNGAVTAASRDAINGSQLYGASAATAAAIGGGSTVDANGAVTKPKVTVAGTDYDNLSGAITATAALAQTGSVDGVKYDTSAHDKVTFNKGSVSTTLSNVAAGVTTTDAVNVGQLAALGATVGTSGVITNAFVAYDTTAKDSVTLAGSNGAQIHKVIAGSTATDAVNVGQLTAMGATIGTSGAMTNAFVAYTDTTKTAVSLGNGTVGAKITNLQNGAVTAASRDAINGSQLYGASAATAAAIGGGSTVDANGAVTKPKVTVAGTDYDNLSGAITATAALAQTGSVDGVKYDTSAHDKVTFNKGSVSTTLSNVAAGVTTTDAVNVGQLAALGATVGTSGVITNAFVAYDTTAKDSVTMAGANGAQIHKVIAGSTATDAVNVGQLTAAGLIVNTSGVVTNAFVAYDTTAKDSVTLAGANGAQIHKVIAGSTATDAVNVGQLTAAGLIVNTSGVVTNAFVAYDTTAKDSVTLAGSNGAQIHKVIAGSTATDAVNVGQLTAAGLIVNTSGVVTNAFVAYDTTAKDSVTLAGANGAQIHKVIAGSTATDAVNVGQLTAMGATIGTSGAMTNAFVAYTDTTKTAVSLGNGTVGAKITNLQNGAVTAASRDAINGSQLYGASAATAAAIGGGSTVDANGAVTKPKVTVAGTDYDNLSGAITATAALAQTGSVDGVKYDTSAHDKVTFNKGSVSTTLSNVAAGVTTTDAVNVGQLAALGATVGTSGVITNSFVAYDSAARNKVTLGDGTTAVTVSNVAAGVAGTDAVNMNQLNGFIDSSKTLSDSLKYVKFGPSTAAQAQATQSNSIAIGGNAFATGAGAMAFGLNARASGINSVAIGVGSTTNIDNTVSFGTAAAGRRLINVADGVGDNDAVNLGQVESLIADNVSKQMVSTQKVMATRNLLTATPTPVLSDFIAVGTSDKIGTNSNTAIGTDSISIGLGNSSTGDQSVAIGSNVNSVGYRSVGMGYGSIVNGASSTAIGVNAQVTADGSLAVGKNVTAETANSTVIGADSYILDDGKGGGLNSVAIGSGNTVTGTSSIVVGNNSNLAGNNTVAIGNNIFGAKATKGALGSNSIVLGNGSDGSQDNVLSIGAAGKERKIVNVAAGTTTTDAVNVGQLNSAIAAIPSGGGTSYVSQDSASKDLLVGSAVEGSHVNFAGLNGVTRELTNISVGTKDTSAVALSQLKPVVAALGGNAKVDETSGLVTGPTYNVRGGTQSTVGDALSSLDAGLTDVNAKIATITPGGSNLVTQDSVSNDILVASTVAGTHVNFAGLNGVTRELTGVSAGTTATSAVALSQLTPVATALGATIDSKTGAVTAPTFTVQNKVQKNASDAITSLDTGITDLKAQIGAAGQGLVVQDAATEDITVAAKTGGNLIDVSGTAGARKITGVAAGSLDVSSLDAINGSQLNSTSTQLATAIGGGMTVDSKTGAITMPSFSVGGNTVYNVGDAITGLDGRINTTNDTVTNLQTTVNNITAGGGVATPNAVAYDTAAHDKLTLGSTAADGTVTTTKITGLADADLSDTSTDAVTGKQLNATNAEVATLTNTVNNFSSTGSTSVGINGADGAAGTAGAAGANGADAIAMGDKASASGDHAIVIGGGASATGSGTIAIGGNAGASGTDSIAIGNGATAPANSAVALGANSVADRDNSVSVGSADQQRQITNVAAGTQGTDAVNLNQMNSAVGGIARKAYSGIAAATALTMIPDVDANKTLSLGIGGGTFQGYAATAIGGTARITQNIKVRVGAGWSAAGTTVGAGASYQW
ncbi:ESPR-type extended signal peptide-containing protein [Caballeronia sp. SBC2]|uniref:YadA-like family protein n=1 Tax=Caballeronia sp. SBC2 TaxID=2705547 RepID=UPI0013E0F37C|nr:ESPR-type extended signal peptide-containing protein [Caballeronia sp. SBC2]QIE22521.1 Coiled stalk of trimeric autotransporter adhesin [Caballeronia sp. SBC2]